MRIVVSQGKRVPIESAGTWTVESHHSKMDCSDAERMREKSRLVEFLDEMEKMQQHNHQFNDTVGFSDLFANVDNDLLRELVAEINRKRPGSNVTSYVDPALDDTKDGSLGARLFQVPSTFGESQIDFNRLSADIKEKSKENSRSRYEMGFGVQQNLAAPSEVVKLSNNQAQQQRLMILELQQQLHNLIVICQQNRQTSLKDQERSQTQGTIESIVKEAESARIQPENVNETEIVATSNLPLPPRCVSSQLDGLESNNVPVDAGQFRQLKKVSRRSRQTNGVDASESSLRKKKQVRSNIRVERGNFTAERDTVVRTKSKTHLCAECGKAFNSRYHLTRHLMIHTGEKPFKCTDCDVAFRRKYHLAVHQKIHSGEKPFECRICGKAFAHKFTLLQHLLIHTNEKPFFCDICKESFRQKNHLSNHMNTHSGNRPYKCNVCRKAFRRRFTLLKHRKVHAKEDE